MSARDRYNEHRLKEQRRYVARAQAAKKRLYEIYGYGAIRQASVLIGKNQNYVANCLNGTFTSRPVLALIEELIAKHDRELAQRNERLARRKAAFLKPPAVPAE